jgi:hypothetical protein
MVKLTTGVNFINILHKKFLYECRFGSFFYVHVTSEKLPKQHSYKKFVRKMLIKLTTGHGRFLLSVSFFSLYPPYMMRILISSVINNCLQNQPLSLHLLHSYVHTHSHSITHTKTSAFTRTSLQGTSFVAPLNSTIGVLKRRGERIMMYGSASLLDTKHTHLYLSTNLLELSTSEFRKFGKLLGQVVI